MSYSRLNFAMLLIIQYAHNRKYRKYSHGHGSVKFQLDHDIKNVDMHLNKRLYFPLMRWERNNELADSELAIFDSCIYEQFIVLIKECEEYSRDSKTITLYFNDLHTKKISFDNVGGCKAFREALREKAMKNKTNKRTSIK